MNPKPRNYTVVDVFSSLPLLGNPVAVVLDADGLDTASMQRIANWTHLSETTFLLPPTRSDADYRLRIFTPRSELPFAGHPTLGSAHAALQCGLVTPRNGRFVQECALGLVPIEVQASDTGLPQWTLDLPPAALRPLHEDDVRELQAVLGCAVPGHITPAIIDVGAVWLVAQLDSTAQLLALQPDLARCAALERRLGLTGVTVYAPRQRDHADVEVRSFAPSCGVNEDPVCGSGNGSVAVFRRERGLLPGAAQHYNATQGQCVGRAGHIAIGYHPQGRITIGGACVTSIEGTLRC